MARPARSSTSRVPVGRDVPKRALDRVRPGSRSSGCTTQRRSSSRTRAQSLHGEVRDLPAWVDERRASSRLSGPHPEKRSARKDQQLLEPWVYRIRRRGGFATISRRHYNRARAASEVRNALARERQGRGVDTASHGPPLIGDGQPLSLRRSYRRDLRLGTLTPLHALIGGAPVGCRHRNRARLQECVVDATELSHRSACRAERTGTG